MARIFLSYRRDDSADVAGRIRDRLVDRFGVGEVFTDVDSIPYGVDFRDYIDQRIAQCEVFVAIIGRDWLTTKNRRGERRIDQADDFVRLEIDSALQRDIPVVPLLVRNATMPREEELPEEIRALAFRNGTPIRPDPDFHPDMDRLIQGLPGSQKARTDAAGGPEPGSAKGRRRRRVGRWLIVGLVVAALAGLISLASLLDDRGRSSPDAGGETVVNPPASRPPSGLSGEQIRGRVIIRAGRDPVVIDQYAGKPRRHYSVWIEAPQEALRQIARVEYQFPEKLFSPAIVGSDNRANGFRYTYLGIGAVYDMDVVVILNEGSRISYSFDMYHAIFGGEN